MTRSGATSTRQATGFYGAGAEPLEHDVRACDSCSTVSFGPTCGRSLRAADRSRGPRQRSRRRLTAPEPFDRTTSRRRGRPARTLGAGGGRNIQTLEGDDDTVAAVFDKIVDDPRHGDVFVIINEPVGQQEFPDWSMGFRDVTDMSDAELPGYSHFMDEDRASAFAGDDATVIKRLLELSRATGK